MFEPHLYRPLNSSTATNEAYPNVNHVAHEMTHYLFGYNHFADGGPFLSGNRSGALMGPYGGGWRGHYSGYEKWRLQWLAPEVVTSNTDIALYELGSTMDTTKTKLLKIPIAGSTQYYLVEYRGWTSAYEFRRTPWSTAPGMLKPGILVYLIIEERDYLTSTPCFMQNADGMFKYGLTHDGGTTCFQLDDVIERVHSQTFRGYHETGDIFIDGRTMSCGNKRESWYISYTPYAGNPYGGGPFLDPTNYLNSSTQGSDLHGDSLDLFQTGDVLTPWSNPGSHIWAGMVVDSFLATTIGMEVGGLQDSSGFRWYDISCRLTNPEGLSPSKPQDLQSTRNSEYAPSLSWTANSEPDVTSGGGYNVYRAVIFDGSPATSYARINSALVTTSSFTDDAWTDIPLPPPGSPMTLSYKITSVDNTALESVKSDSTAVHYSHEELVLAMAYQNKSTSPSATWNNSGRHVAQKDDYLHEVFLSEGNIFYRRQYIPTGEWEKTHWVASISDNNSPSVCVDKESTIHIVWQRDLGQNHFELWYAQGFDNGENWTQPVILPNCQEIEVSGTQLSIYPVIAQRAENELVVVFCTVEGLKYTVSVDAGESWSDPEGILSQNSEDSYVWYPSLAPVSDYLMLTYDYRFDGVWSRIFNGETWGDEENVNTGIGTIFDRCSSVSDNGYGWPIAAWCAQRMVGGQLGVRYRIVTREYTSWGWQWFTEFAPEGDDTRWDFYPSISARYGDAKWSAAIIHHSNNNEIFYKLNESGNWSNMLVSNTGLWANLSLPNLSYETTPTLLWTDQGSSPYAIEVRSDPPFEGMNRTTADSSVEKRRRVVIQDSQNGSFLSFEMSPLRLVTTTGDTVDAPFKVHRPGEPVTATLDSVWQYLGTEAFTVPSNAASIILEASISAQASTDTAGRSGTNSFTTRSFAVNAHRGTSTILLWVNASGESGRFEADVRQFAGQRVVVRPLGGIPNALRSHVTVSVGDVFVSRPSEQAGAASRASGPSLLPTVFNLSQNYPNPFNPSTQINYDLPEPATVSLVVYDVLGREVAELVSGYREAGYHSVTWNVGAGIASGVYLARFTAANADAKQVYAKSIKVMMVK